MCTLLLLYDLYFYIIMHALHPNVALKLSEDDLFCHTLLLMNSQADIWGSACEWTWITFGVAKKKKSSWHREHVYTGSVSGANVP